MPTLTVDTGVPASLTGTFLPAVAHKFGDCGTALHKQTAPDLEISRVHQETEASVFLLAQKGEIAIKWLRQNQSKYMDIK